MAVSYTPKAVWHEQINTIEKADQVKGSIVGAANIPHQQLADSAAFLLARVVSLENGEVLPPTTSADYGAWQISSAAEMRVGVTATVTAVNDKHKSKPLTWTASLYNVDSAGELSNKTVVSPLTAIVSDANGKISAKLPEIPVLAKAGSTVSQKIVFEINWGGEKNTIGVYAKISAKDFAVAAAAPVLPRPTDGFTYMVQSYGAVGDPAATATITGILTSNALDGEKGSITQLINYNYANPANANNQITTKDNITISDGQWSANFGTALVGTALANAGGNQGKINKITYVFSIAGRRFEKIGAHY